MRRDIGPEQLFGGYGSLCVAVGRWVDRSYHDNLVLQEPSLCYSSKRLCSSSL